MKAKLFWIPGVIALIWIVYAIVVTSVGYGCGKLVYISMGHVVFLLLTIGFLIVSSKGQSVVDENYLKNEELRRKKEYETHQTSERLRKIENEEFDKLNTEIDNLKGQIDNLQPDKEKIKKIYLLTSALSQQGSNLSAEKIKAKVTQIKDCLEEIENIEF